MECLLYWGATRVEVVTDEAIVIETLLVVSVTAGDGVRTLRLRDGSHWDLVRSGDA